MAALRIIWVYIQGNESHHLTEIPGYTFILHHNSRVMEILGKWKTGYINYVIWSHVVLSSHK